MSRHLWRADIGSDNPPPPQHLGIFAATVRALKGLSGRPAPERSVPEPRPAPRDVESPEETTVELPRYVVMEPTEPALAMLAKGRHSMR